MNKRFWLLVCTIVLLVITVVPVGAKSEVIPITGVCYIYKWGGGGEGELPTDPNYRIWESGTGAHWRNQLWLFWCDYNDDRLDGSMLVYDDWNMTFDESKDFIAHNFGQDYSADENGNILYLWEGSHVGIPSPDWSYSSHFNYKGLGMYKGLIAQLDMTLKVGDSAYTVVGELKETGN